MSSTQDACEDMVTMKRKKLKIFSEFNYSSMGEEVTELGPKPDCNQYVKKTFNTLWRDKPIIDVYLRNQKSRFHNINHIPFSLYDTKLDKKTVIDSLMLDDRSYNYSGTDIKRLLIFMEYTYNAMQHLMMDDKTSKTQGTRDFNTTILVIDSEKLKKFFKDGPDNLMKNQRKQNFPGGDVSYEDKETSAALNIETVHNYNSFDISIEQKCMEFKLSICKYSFNNLLETLTAVCSFSRLYFPIYDISKVPSLYLGNWHFRNITQGYLLRILLRNVNVNTLNVMRKLYFVLITDTTSPSLNIQINLILKHGIFLVYEADSYNAFISGTDDWKINHRCFLRRSTFVDPLYIFSKWNDTETNLISAITHSQSSDFPTDQSAKHHIEDSSYIDVKDDTFFAYSKIESRNKLRSEADVASVAYSAIVLPKVVRSQADGASVVHSDIESIHTARSDATINLTYNKSVGTSFILSLDVISSQFEPVEKKSASTLCDLTFETAFKTSILAHSEWWLRKLSHGSETLKSCLYLQIDYENINETMFNAASTDMYVKFVSKYLKQVTSQKFYKDFFKCLAQSLVYVLFSFKA